MGNRQRGLIPVIRDMDGTVHVFTDDTLVAAAACAAAASKGGSPYRYRSDSPLGAIRVTVRPRIDPDDEVTAVMPVLTMAEVVYGAVSK